MKRKLATIAFLVLLAPSSHALEFSSLTYEQTVPYIMFIGTGGTLNESVDLVDANGGVALATSQVANIFIDGQLTVGWFFFDDAAIAADPPAQVTVRTITEESAVYTLPPLPPPCIDKDWTAGAPTTTECMPESDRSVFLEEEFFDSQGTSVRRLVEPEEWCRADLVQQRLYWPREAGANCAVWPQAQIDMSTAANTSRQYWEGLGCGDWYKSHTVNFEVEFTEIQTLIRGEAFASLDSPLDEGHIFINSALAQSGSDDAAGAVLHELTHAAIEFSIYPSAIANQWAAERLWPEAIATAAMIDNQHGSNHFVGVHGPWPNMWRDGLKYGSNKARHAALLILYLKENQGFNSCQFMLDQHALLLEGDEIGAFEAEVPNFRRWFSRFVANYNMRTDIPGIEFLPPASPFPIAPTAENFVWGVANGLLDGETVRIPSAGLSGFSLGLEASGRCPEHEAVITIRKDGLAWLAQNTIKTGEYKPTGSSLWGPWDLLITVASIEGDTHMKKLVVTSWQIPNIPNDPWPAQDLNDPFPSGCE